MSLGRALVVSGGGRFADAWHPFAATSAVLADALTAYGYDPEIDADADRCLSRMGDPPAALLVLNLGGDGADRFSAEATSGLLTGLQTGLPTLVVHSSPIAFPDWPVWRRIVGGGWTPGVSYHPDYGPARVRPVPDHPLTRGLGQLGVTDERYTSLWVDASSSVFLRHTEAGTDHPLGWTRTWGASPVVVDALGHDAAAYGSPGRRLLLARELDWLDRS